jgi:integrase
LPISLDLDRELRLWLEAYQEACGPLRDDWFLTPARHRGLDGPTREVSKLKPNQQMIYHTALRIVHQGLARIGMDEKGAGTHTLRRSTGRAVFDAAVEDGDARAIHIARELLGHKNVAMTEVYIGTNVEKQRLNDTMRGQAFLSRRSGTTDSNVVSLADARRRKGSGT